MSSSRIDSENYQMRLLSLALVIGLFGFACELHAQFVTVNVQINPPGAGTVVDNFGITYPGPAISYTNGTTITFTANP